MKTVLPTLACILAASATLADDTLSTSSWCGGGETMHLSATGIGFNDGAICTTAPAFAFPDVGGSWSGQLTCKNVITTGFATDGSAITRDEPLPDRMLTVTRTDEEAATLTFAPGGTLETERCG